MVQQADDALTRRLPDHALVLPAGADEPVVLTGTALALWDVLADDLAVDDIVDRLASHFGADRATVAADVVPALDRLRRLRALAGR